MNCKDPAMKMMMFVLAMLIVASVCAGQTYWKRAYGGTKNDAGGAITPTPDGNFIAAGYTSSFGAGGENVYLLKIKPNGDTIWTRTYGGTGDDVPYAITTTLDGNFIVAGQTSSFGVGAGNTHVYILKIKPNGDTLWTKTYGVSNNDYARAIVASPDGNFIVAGGTDSCANGSRGVYLLKIKPDGDTIWTKTYGGGNHSVSAIVLTQDGNFMVAGQDWLLHYPPPPSDGFPWTSGNLYLLKVTLNGDTIWTKTYGGNDSLVIDEADAITQTIDGNFIVAATTSSSLSGESEAYILKLKPNGDTILTRNYNVGRGVADAITPTSDGNFIVVATAVTLPPGSGDWFSDNYFLKINLNADTIWTKTYGPGGDFACGIAPTPEGNFIATGIASSFGSGLWDVYLLSLIDDRYAYNNTPFTFTIPGSDDSLQRTYTPVKTPSGMTVTKGGTISWTPRTDSVYTEHIVYSVTKGTAINDTLTFNIFVNSQYHSNKTLNPISRSSNSSPNDLIIRPLSSKEVNFSLPSGTSSLCVYDLRGQLLENLSVRNNQAVWLPKHGSGRYFAKAIYEKSETVKGFTIVK